MSGAYCYIMIYVKPFLYNAGACPTDRRTDRIAISKSLC